MKYAYLTTGELQSMATDNDNAAAELGRRFIDIEIHGGYFGCPEFRCNALDEALQEIDDMMNEPGMTVLYEEGFDAGIRVGIEEAIRMGT